MKNSTKMLLGAASIASLVGVAAPAVAQDDAPAFSLSGYAAVTSDYKFRGISQNDRDFAPQGSLNLTGPDGWYVGTWASQVDWQAFGMNDNPSVEVDIYGGKHTDLWGYADWNLQAYYYAYPGADTLGTATADFFELINQLSHTYGPVTLTATWAWSPEFSLGGGTGNYLAGNAVIPINDWLSISGTVGHQWVQNAKYAGSGDYTHADIGVTASYMGFALDLRYNGTDMNTAACAFYMGTRNACAGNFIATLTYNVALLP